MKFSQFLKEKELSIPKDAPSVETIAKKHGVSVEYVKKQLEVGIKVESEHSKNKGVEREIALDHLNEKPDYYVKLKKYVEEVEQIDEADTWSIKNKKTGQTYHMSKYEIKPSNTTYKKIKAAGGEHIHAAIHKNGKLVEDVEQLDELSPATIASYKQKAKEQIPALMKHSKTGEYKDIAKNILKRRLKGMSRASISEGENKEMKGKDPCWKGYQMVGMKNKGGRKVPNCVPEEVEHIEEMDKSQPSSDRGGESSGNPWAKGSKATPITAKKAKTNFLSVLNKSIDKSNKAKQDTATKMAKHKMKEEVKHLDELSNELLGRYKDAAVVSHNKAEAEKNYKLSDKRFSGVVKATNKQFANTRKKYAKEETEKDKAPFEGGKKSKGTVVDKSGAKHTSMSRARDLARKAMKQVSDKKMKNETMMGKIGNLGN